MKRFFTSLSLLCMVLFTTHAQNTEFRYHGQALEDDATVTIYAEADPIFGDLTCNTNPMDNPSNGLVLANRTGATVRGNAFMTIEKNAIGARQIQWCMGGTCQIMKEASLEKAFSVPANGNCMVQFDADVLQEGELLATLTVMVGAESHTVNIRFVYNADRIHTAKDKKVVTDYFTLDGRRVATQPLGVSLARYADGSVRKVIKK